VKFIKSTNIFVIQRPQITLLPTFTIARQAKFRLEESENKVLIFVPSNGPSEIYLRTPKICRNSKGWTWSIDILEMDWFFVRLQQRIHWTADTNRLLL